MTGDHIGRHDMHMEGRRNIYTIIQYLHMK